MAYDDPYQNYLRLKNTVQYLQAGGRVTEDWLREHVAYILKYYEMFSVISDVNLEVEDSEFRNLAKETENLLQNLINCINEDEWFDINQYLKLNINLIKMCEILQLEQDLESVLNALSIH
jgi:hypothetical protein